MPVLDCVKTVVRTALPSPLYRLYRKQRHSYEIRRYRSRTVRHRYGDTTLTVALEDGLAEGWYDHDWPDPLEIGVLKQNGLMEGATVFDLGAHQAVVALMLAHYVGSSGHVVAVEAEPHNCQVARRNLALNAATNIEVVEAAISDRAGTVWFSEGLNGCIDGTSSSLGKIEARSVTIDDLVDQFGAPDVLLIDVEGHEAKALAGAKRTLAEARPQVVIEVHGQDALGRVGSTPLDVLAPLKDYEVLIAGEEGGFRPVAERRALLSSRCWLFARPSQHQMDGNAD